MEGNYLTSGDLALFGYGHQNYGNVCNYQRGSGKATTGIGLAAGLGGGALFLAIAGLWGLNEASKARAKGSQTTIDALTNNVNQLATIAITERNSRESWQLAHAPSIQQYVDVRAGAGAGANANSNALAQAEANLLTGALTGAYARCPQEVTLVSKDYCKCPTSNPCGM